MVDVKLTDRHQAGAALAGRLRTELELLDRHLRMLHEVRDHGPVGILRLGEALDLPAHRVRYSLRLLEEAGLVQPTTAGARAADDLDAALAAIGGLLDEAQEQLTRLRGHLAALQDHAVPARK